MTVPLWKLFGWFRRPQLWATGDWQLHHNNVPAHTPCHMQIFGETSNHPGDSAPLTAHLWCPAIFGFFQNYNHFCKGRDFRPLMRFRKIWQGSWWWLGELCEVPRYLLWRGLRCHCLMYSVSCIFFNKCLYFSYYVTGYFLDRPLTYGVYICKRTQSKRE